MSDEAESSSDAEGYLDYRVQGLVPGFLFILRYIRNEAPAIVQDRTQEKMNIGEVGSVRDLPISVAASTPNAAPTMLPEK